jgi:hypothetical protein
MRILVYAMMAVVLALFPAVASGNASSAATTNCNPVTWRYEVRQANIPAGVIRLNTNVCTTNGNISSSSASASWSPNPLGYGTGWRWDNNRTVRLSQNATNVSWRHSALFKVCVPTQVSPICSYDSTYSVDFFAYPKSFVGPPIPPAFACTNQFCRNGMTFVYQGRS